MVDLKSGNRTDARKAVKAAIKSCTKDHDLTEAVPQCLRDNVVDEAGPGDGGRSRTWCSPVRIPRNGIGQVWNSSEHGRSPERRPKKVDCKWIREGPSAGWTDGLQRPVKRHVLSGSTGFVRFHGNPQISNLLR